MFHFHCTINVDAFPSIGFHSKCSEGDSHKTHILFICFFFSTFKENLIQKVRKTDSYIVYIVLVIQCTHIRFLSTSIMPFVNFILPHHMHTYWKSILYRSWMDDWEKLWNETQCKQNWNFFFMFFFSFIEYMVCRVLLKW